MHSLDSTRKMCALLPNIGLVLFSLLTRPLSPGRTLFLLAVPHCLAVVIFVSPRLKMCVGSVLHAEP